MTDEIELLVTEDLRDLVRQTTGNQSIEVEPSSRLMNSKYNPRGIWEAELVVKEKAVGRVKFRIIFNPDYPDYYEPMWTIDPTYLIVVLTAGSANIPSSKQNTATSTQPSP